jgi:hypothetical protein
MIFLTDGQAGIKRKEFDYFCFTSQAQGIKFQNVYSTCALFEHMQEVDWGHATPVWANWTFWMGVDIHRI